MKTILFNVKRQMSTALYEAYFPEDLHDILCEYGFEVQYLISSVVNDDGDMIYEICFAAKTEDCEVEVEVVSCDHNVQTLIENMDKKFAEYTVSEDEDDCEQLQAIIERGREMMALIKNKVNQVDEFGNALIIKY